MGKREYDELRAEVGHIVPCYGRETGCRADDETNEAVCVETGCLMLAIYRAGIEQGRSTRTATAKEG